MKTLVILFTLLFTTLAHAGSTQSNVSGSNTAIEGGYESSTTYQSGSSSNSTTTNSTTSNIRSAPPSAYAPGVNSSGIDVCSTGASMGMKVAAVALLCQDPRVFEAMIHAGTPCPYQGKIGDDANKLWKKYDKLRPDYNQYTKDLKVVKTIDKKHDKIIIKNLPNTSVNNKAK